MPTKIRLSRHGRKRNAYYYIVAADSRAPRDGKYIERIGTYNPNTNPATIELDFDKALDWLQKGAQPTDTCRAILSYRGVLMKKHLLDGAKKGAFSEEEAESRFGKWMQEKEAKIQAKKDSINKSITDAEKERLEIERKINEARAEELAKKKVVEAPAEKEAATEEAAEEAPAEAAAEEAPSEEPKAEKAEEKPAEEKKAEEKPAEEKPAEKPKAEEKAAEEKPAEEPKAEEKPAEEKPAEGADEGEKKE
ncbi:MAG: 30S ribosomal protein S16 [Bacteroidota bacterium]